NAASTLQDVWIAGETAPDLADFMSKVTGASSVRKGANLTVLQTPTGAIILARPNALRRPSAYRRRIPRTARTLPASPSDAAALPTSLRSTFQRSEAATSCHRPGGSVPRSVSQN